MLPPKKKRNFLHLHRRIGDFLKELKLIEGRNTGFPNVIMALKANGSGMLRFEMDEGRSFLSVTIPIHTYFVSAEAEQLIAEKKVVQNVVGGGVKLAAGE